MKDKPVAEDEPKPVESRRRLGRVSFKDTCYNCCEEGHRSFECSHPDCKVGDIRVAVVNENEDLVKEPEVGDSFSFGEYCLVRRARTFSMGNLFGTRCQSRGNCWNEIADSGSTDNLVVEEMV